MNQLRNFLFKVFFSVFVYLFIDNYLSKWSPLIAKVWNLMFHLALLPLVKVTTLALKINGYEVTTNYNILQVAGTDGVYVNNAAIGVGFMFCFAVLILFYPGGDKRKKLWFIPLGVLAIFISSVIRLYYLVSRDTTPGLYLIQEQHDSFSIAMFILIFILWFIWVRLVNKISFN
ncbi:MAG: hypothetical protein ACK4GL_07745 [Flavobacteriales bacterium]